jgi:membrane-associated phospholipid phosphatase
LLTAVACLCTFVLLSLVVADGRGPFEDPVFSWLGAPAAAASWAVLSERLTTPLIGVVLVLSVALGVARQALLRVAIYAAFAVLVFLVSEHVAKPLIHRSYYGELTFPSGSVTAVSATAFGAWLAVSPSLGKRVRVATFVIAVAWILLVATAVVGALWHTPLDDLGSILLSIGIVAGGGAVFERATARPTDAGAEHPVLGRQE